MKDHLKKQYNRLHISEEDFYEAQIYIRRCIELDDPAVKRGLKVAALISYCRPFTQNKGESGASTTITITYSKDKNLIDFKRREIIDKEFDLQALDKLHGKAMSIRNMSVAHSSYESNPVRTYFREVGVTACSQSTEYHIDTLAEYDLEKLIKFALVVCKYKMRVLHEKITKS